jgi:hypothetical protein
MKTEGTITSQEYDFATNLAMQRFPKARRTAVRNFPQGASLDNGMANALNLEADRKAYGWDTHTINAIRFVMDQVGKPW